MRLARGLERMENMDVARVIIASIALVFSGWCVYDAQSSSQMLHRSEGRYRSAEEELRRMQQQPEQALVLWLPGELQNRAEMNPADQVPARKPSRKAAKATGWPAGQMPNLAEAR